MFECKPMLNKKIAFCPSLHKNQEQTKCETHFVHALNFCKNAEIGQM